VTGRRDARRIAIDILYQADVTDSAPENVSRAWQEAGRSVPPFAQELVEGVAEHQPEIDLLLEEQAEDWTVARMASLDRTILRVAVEELLYREDVPPSAAISEAVEAASALSSEGSKRFVNGILGAIARASGRSDVPAEPGAG
jgi:transcription antitermination protein NusB